MPIVDDTLALIAAERRTLADLVDTLDESQLRTQSLCSAWTAHDIAAHVLMPLVTPVRRVLVTLAASGFDFSKANVKLTARVAGKPAAEIAQGLRDRAESRFHPPGMGLEAPLTDLLIHGQDLRRPLGIGYTPPANAVRAALDFLTTAKAERAFRAKGILDGVSYEATDLSFAFGSGPVVRGRGIDLLLVMSGREGALDHVEGDGVDVLRARPRRD